MQHLGLSALGFISITNLMSDTNSSLHLFPTTTSGINRTCQEFMKTTLDNANNNKNFVVTCPATFGATCP